jgi:hypothetical protein
MSPEQSIEICREFAAAVEFVAAVERPGLTIWCALAEAVGDWLDIDAGRGCLDEDTLRSVLQQVLVTTPEVGAPGGVGIDAILDAAMSAWIDVSAKRINDGRPFARSELVPRQATFAVSANGILWRGTRA